VRHANPLVQASRLHAFSLSRAALPRMTDPQDAEARIDMCAAAMLQNRDEDDGGRPMDAHWVARAVYALGAALFNQAAQLDQGSTHALLTGPAIRYFGELCPEAVRDMVQALSIPDVDASGDMATIGDAAGQWFAQSGIPMRLRDFDVSKDLLAAATEHAMQNFNADRNRELPQ